MARKIYRVQTHVDASMYGSYYAGRTWLFTNRRKALSKYKDLCQPDVGDGVHAITFCSGEAGRKGDYHFKTEKRWEG